MPKVTKRSVDGLCPGAAIWDDELPGFGARCRDSGSTYYFLKYRIGARQRWHAIGRHGVPWTPEEARREALRLLSEVVRGNDSRSDAGSRPKSRDDGRTLRPLPGRRGNDEEALHNPK